MTHHTVANTEELKVMLTSKIIFEDLNTFKNAINQKLNAKIERYNENGNGKILFSLNRNILCCLIYPIISI